MSTTSSRNPIDILAAAAAAMLGKQEQQQIEENNEDQEGGGGTIAISEDDGAADTDEQQRRRQEEEQRRQREVVSPSPNPSRSETPSTSSPGVAVAAVVETDNNNTRSYSHSESFNPRAVEELLRREMEQLSVIEKENIEDEIHGYMTQSPSLSSPQNNREMEELSLRQMEHEIQSLPSTKKKAYEYALGSLNSQYIFDQQFRMKFLRTENFDSHAASIRFCKWLDILQEYYGDFALTRPLYMTDLGKDELRLLRLGTLQIFPTRDRAGRRVAIMIGSMGGDKFSVYCRVSSFVLFVIWFDFCSCCKSLNLYYYIYSPVQQQIKLTIYMYSVFSDDEMTQRNGLVFIIKPDFDLKNVVSDQEQQRQATRFFAGMPLRYTGYHLWMFSDDEDSSQDDGSNTGSGGGTSATMQAVIRALVLLSLGEKQRKVTRIHTGKFCFWKIKRVFLISLFPRTIFSTVCPFLFDQFNHYFDRTTN